MTIIEHFHGNAGRFATLCFVLEQLIDGEQRTHPIDKSRPPDPRKFGDRKLGSRPSSATVARAIADYCKGALAAAFHQHPILICAATFNTICR